MAPGTALIGLGSNLGDRTAYLRRALVLLAQLGQLQAVSSVYETPPWGYQEQPSFLNAACRLNTDLPAPALLEEMLHLEQDQGRQRQRHWGPRTIDLDLLFYDDLVLQTAGLTLPHPLLHQRAFVLVPLAEIAPHWLHPQQGRTVLELLETCPGREQIQRWAGPASIWP
ncbi:MAG: 2-amino-4-hydroxy-6-hydroxymethyldihydropteridine diphosphokinase [Chloroflexia bacterium]|nr:2-amino-4-hydroxy-6-hydroxymethyldihydropteridine diphosphokinase [Chloroflexia bacterium]